MHEPLQDRTVIIIIISTILTVFLIIFTIAQPKNEFNRPIEWRDNQIISSNEMNVNSELSSF